MVVMTTQAIFFCLTCFFMYCQRLFASPWFWHKILLFHSIHFNIDCGVYLYLCGNSTLLSLWENWPLLKLVLAYFPPFVANNCSTAHSNWRLITKSDASQITYFSCNMHFYFSHQFWTIQFQGGLLMVWLIVFKIIFGLIVRRGMIASGGIKLWWHWWEKFKRLVPPLSICLQI